MPDNKNLKTAIQTALGAFEKRPLAEASLEFLAILGYQSDKTLPISPNTADQFQAQFNASRLLNPETALVRDWRSVDLLFQLTDAEIRTAINGAKDMFALKKVDNKDIRSYLFFALELTGEKYTRAQLAGITREINKLFPMPVMVIFKYSKAVSLAIIARRINKKDESKDVLEKVTLIKDILFTGNRAQIEILHDLAITQLMQGHEIANFVDLQKAWEKTLDLNELNKKFYKEIANWYFWAVKTVKFPKDAEKDEATRNATGVIRLITRLIFVWFIKEKGLVPEDLFDARWLKDNLDFSDAKKSTYYKAILQNLFFATLNTEMDAERVFRRENAKGQDPDYLMSNFYRYKRYFKKPDAALGLFAGIPFLNGGLFECLDKEIEKGNVIRVDGFSDRDDNPLEVPEKLFLQEDEADFDLNEIYDTKNKKYKVRGLIHIFNSYKFTIEENTPIEEEIALDPELLGKVFENLLAAYNPETGTTARKQTGSFYTPREIVNYMVDEALVAYLETALSDLSPQPPSQMGRGSMPPSPLGEGPGVGSRLRSLLAYNNEPPQFNNAEKTQLISAIDNVKVLDPACGSGAFPMGVLHKLVFILSKVDPDNERWKQKQIDNTKASDSLVQEAQIKAIEEVFADNHNDYGRKLYLIENCIYGVDIQPIAVQIAKLRFFISLVVDQKTNAEKPNLGIRPLPNLETKFVAANTLIGIQRPDSKPVDVEPVSISPEIETLCNQLLDSLRQYLKVTRPEVKAQWLAQAKEQGEQINSAMKSDSSFQPLAIDWIFNTAKDTAALKILLPVKREAKATMLTYRSQDIIDKEKELERVRRDHFSARTPKTKRQAREKDKELREAIAKLLTQGGWEDEAAQQLAGWDPYNQNAHADFFDPEWMFGVEGGFDVVIGNPPYVRQEQISEFKLAFQKQYSCYTGTADLYVYFYERGIQALRENGVLVYISSNKYFRSGYGEKLRGFLGRQTSIRNLIDFGDAPVFTAIAYPSIIVTQKKVVMENHVRALAWKVNDPLDEFSDILQTRTFMLSQKELVPSGWRLESQIALRLLEKLKSIGKPLEEYVNGRMYRGVVTGFNDAFIIDKETRDRLIKEDRISAEIIKPFVRGRDIKRWLVDYQDLWVIFTRRGIDIKKYPAIFQYLKKFKTQLTPGAEGGRKPGSYQWYEIQDNTAYWQEFENVQIVWGNLATEPKFSFAEEGFYISAPANTIVSNSKYLLGILNSNITHYIVSQSAAERQGGFLEFKPMYISPLAIPEPPKNEKISSLVTKILTAKRADPQADASALEGEIDQLVYQLYGLSEEEIKIIEGKEAG